MKAVCIKSLAIPRVSAIGQYYFIKDKIYDVYPDIINKKSTNYIIDEENMTWDFNNIKSYFVSLQDVRKEKLEKINSI